MTIPTRDSVVRIAVARRWPLGLAVAVLIVAAACSADRPVAPAAGPIDLSPPGADRAGASDLPAGLATRPVWVQDLSSCAPGSRPADAVDNSGWAGGTVGLQVVETGDPRRPRVVACEASNYCQIAFGDFALRKGRIYRTSLDVAAKGGASLDVLLRILPVPWTTMVASKEKARDDFTTITFLGRCAADVDKVCVMLINPGSVSMQVANIRVDEVVGDVVLEAPPVAGNLVLNGSFELDGDGWFVRAWGSPARPRHLAIDDAPDGRRVVEVSDKTMLSSPWMKFSFQADYLIRARARVTGPAGSCRLNFVGNSSGWKGTTAALQAADGWRTLSLTIRPEAVREGKLQRFLDGFIAITVEGGPVQVDAVEVRALVAGAPVPPAFAPHAALELGIAIDPSIAMGVAQAGAPVPLRIRASGDAATARLLVLDEERRLLREQPIAFADRVAEVVLRDLPPGYLMVRTAPPDAVSALGRVEGETFLCVVPAMPDVPLAEWLYGTHVIDYLPLRQACWNLGWRWDRLHDMGMSTKWATVQPAGPDGWTFQDGIVDQRLRSGFGLFGSLESTPAWAPRAAEPKIPDWGCQFPVFTAATMAPWSEYARRTAEHFAGRIDVFEVGNEPQITKCSAERYVEVLRATAQAVKAGNPHATVVGLGGMVAGDPLIAECLRLGAAKHCDALSIHGYNLTTWATVDGPERLQAVVAELRELIKANGGDPAMPIIDSESGTTSPSCSAKFYAGIEDGYGEALAMARMFPKSIAGIKAAGLARWFFYFANDDNFAGDTNHFRICSVNDTMRMPVQPMAVAISALEGRRFVSQDAADAARGIVHLVFAGRGASVHMLWTRTGTAQVAVPAGTTRVMGMWGRDVEAAGGRLALSPSPVYAFTP